MPGTSRTSNFRPLRLLAGSRDQRHLISPREAVVQRAAAQPVAVADLDDLDAGLVQGPHGFAHLLLGEPVRHRVTAVAQRGVGNA